jgi:hypothetical protein
MRDADAAAERAVRSFAAALIGEIGHELSNRLATMRETVGLLEDLARAGKAGAGRVALAHASLDDQVGRTLNIVRVLAGLGRSLGAVAAGFDAGAATDELLAANERWARRLSLRIEREIAQGLPQAAGEPAVFLCLLQRLLARCAGCAEAGSGVVVRLERAGEGIAVRLAPSGRGASVPAATGEEEEIDRELVARLGGELTFHGGGAATVRLTAVR